MLLPRNEVSAGLLEDDDVLLHEKSADCVDLSKKTFDFDLDISRLML